MKLTGMHHHKPRYLSSSSTSSILKDYKTDSNTVACDDDRDGEKKQGHFI